VAPANFFKTPYKIGLAPQNKKFLHLPPIKKIPSSAVERKEKKTSEKTFLSIFLIEKH
jgi:hypothetical protein